MDRVQASEAWGRGFESHAARQKNKMRVREGKRTLFLRTGDKKGEEILAFFVNM